MSAASPGASGTTRLIEPVERLGLAGSQRSAQARKMRCANHFIAGARPRRIEARRATRRFVVQVRGSTEVRVPALHPRAAASPTRTGWAPRRRWPPDRLRRPALRPPRCRRRLPRCAGTRLRVDRSSARADWRRRRLRGCRRPRMGERRPSIVLQRSQLRIGIDEVAACAERAAVVALQVVAT